MDLQVVLIIGAVIGFGIWSYHKAKKRREAIALLAQKLGLRFDEGKNHKMAQRYGFLDKLDQGSNRYAFNILSGEFHGHSVTAFDYHFQITSYTGKSRKTEHHYLSFYVLSLERGFPELTIAKEGLLSKIAQTLGHDDIDFESHEFSDRYVVRCNNKKFAYDFCNAQMIDYLLDLGVVSIEVEKNSLALAYDGSSSFSFSRDSRLDVENIERHLKRLVKIRTLMPDYLFTR